MNDPNHAAVPAPELVFDTLVAYQKSAALKAAIELDLFSAIGGDSFTAIELAARIGSSARGTRILADFLTIMGLLSKTGDRYSLTATSAAFLDKASPAYFGSISTFLTHGELQKGFWALAGAVRQGGTTMSDGGTVAPENPIWVEFARAMAPMARMTAVGLADEVLAHGSAGRVLDVAAGSGAYGIALAQRDPQTQVTALDWPSVLELTAANAHAAGVAQRYSTIPGSAFERDWVAPGEDGHFDTILFTNFLHHFDADACVSLFRKAHAALRPGGRVVTLEFVPNPDRVTPPAAAGFSLVMLAGTAGGDAYTSAELDQMALQAGFSRCETKPVPRSPQSVHFAHR